MARRILTIFSSQQFGLVVVIVLLGLILSSFAGTYQDRQTGHVINNFLNWGNLIQIATITSFFAIMAVGAAMVIISGGIDLSVGSVYALCGTSMALLLRTWHLTGIAAVAAGAGVCCAIGIVCGLINGTLIFGLKVHPFVITLGTMWVFRGLAFVTSAAESIPVPDSLTAVAKNPLGLRSDLYPVPLLFMLVVTLFGWIFLNRTVAGRRVFAVGGNVLASIYSGVKVNRVYVTVYTIAGLCAGISAFIGSSYFGAASCGDAQGYELYVIASAVVGGVSLLGGRGSAVGAMLGALLIVMMRQAITTLHLDQNYESIIIGCAIVVAVVLDRVSGNLGARRLARAKSV